MGLLHTVSASLTSSAVPPPNETTSSIVRVCTLAQYPRPVSGRLDGAARGGRVDDADGESTDRQREPA